VAGSPWGGSFLCEGFFSSHLEPGPGWKRDACQVNPSCTGWCVCVCVCVCVCCEEHLALSSDPPSCSQEPPDSFLCSWNIPLTSRVSEFSKPGPWACLNKSWPPATLPHCLAPQPLLQWVQCHIGFPFPGLGSQTLPREIWPRSAVRVAAPYTRHQGFTRGGGQQEMIFILLLLLFIGVGIEPVPHTY
jgi:hypothetical protein